MHLLLSMSPNAKIKNIQMEKEILKGMVSAIEKMSDDVLKEEQKDLTAEIEALNDRLRSVENEMFYRSNPECRR